MRFQLRRCSACRAYTIREACPRCKANASLAHPARFSPDDKYARYRLASRYQKPD
jgi:H/ACA ribonucleoprotein complex subunit 3